MADVDLAWSSIDSGGSLGSWLGEGGKEWQALAVVTAGAGPGENYRAQMGRYFQEEAFAGRCDRIRSAEPRKVVEFDVKHIGLTNVDSLPTSAGVSSS